MGVVAGVLASIVPSADYTNGVALGILVYLISFYYARYIWYKGVDRQYQGKIYTMGLGGFVGLFLFTWILIFTLSSV